MRKKKDKTKPSQPRNWLAVHAHNKTSAGPMKSKKENKRDIFKEIVEGIDSMRSTRRAQNTDK